MRSCMHAPSCLFVHLLCQYVVVRRSHILDRWLSLSLFPSASASIRWIVCLHVCLCARQVQGHVRTKGLFMIHPRFCVRTLVAPHAGTRKHNTSWLPSEVPFIHAFIRSFIISSHFSHSLINSVTTSFIHAFIHLFDFNPDSFQSFHGLTHTYIHT